MNSEITRPYSHEDYSHLLTELISPLQSYLTDEHPFVVLPQEYATNYSQKEARIESFSRLLLGLSLLDIQEDLANLVLGKIQKGIFPASLDYWGEPRPGAQLNVELFPILFFCYRHQTRVTDSFKEDIALYFGQINRIEIGKNNWLFFPILDNLLLNKIGLPYSEKKIVNCWHAVDQLYLSNGWYRDGSFSEQEDYYNAYAFHFYSLLYAFLSPEDEERNTLILERANQFAESYIYFFTDSGEYVPFGRSLTYKCAPIAFWSMLSLFEQDEDRLGIIKGIINRNLRWWLSQEIFTSDHTLCNGFAYANPFMLEQYNGTGSPYWALKPFFLLLNPESRYFQVEEKRLPDLEPSIFIPEAHLSIHRSNGNVFLFMNGQHNPNFCGSIAKYEKFCYSSLFGFCVPRSDTNYSTLAPDSTLVIHIGETTMIRRNATVIMNSPKVQISDWSPLPGITIRSFVFPSAPWHTRIHYVVSDYYVELRDYGFAVEDDSDEAFSEIVSPTASVEYGIQPCAPNTNILHPRTHIPYARIEFPIGKHVFVTAIYGDNRKPCGEPDCHDISLKNDTLFAFGESYPLPKVSVRQKIRKILNTIK